jgi:hypothetical protein
MTILYSTQGMLVADFLGFLLKEKFKTRDTKADTTQSARINSQAETQSPKIHRQAGRIFILYTVHRLTGHIVRKDALAIGTNSLIYLPAC